MHKKKRYYEQLYTVNFTVNISDTQLNRYLKKQISVRNFFQVVRSILLDKLPHELSHH